MQLKAKNASAPQERVPEPRWVYRELARETFVPPTGSTRAKSRLPSVKRSPNELANARSSATSP